MTVKKSVGSKALKIRHLTGELPSGQASVPARWVLVTLACVFVLKLVVLLQLRDHPLTQPDSGLDTTAYVDLAKQVLDGNWGLGPGVYYVSPFYIYFLAAGLAVLKSFTAVRVLQILLGTGSVAFLFYTTRTWFGERAAWIAAALAAFTGLFTFYEVLILQASVDAFLTSAALYFLTRGLTLLPPKGGNYRAGERAYLPSSLASRPVDSASKSSPVVSAFRRNLFVAGLLFGVQTLNRPNVMLAALGIALVMLIVTRRVAPAAVLAAGLALGLSPAAVRNAMVAHEWSFVSSHGGLNFYIGNRETATGFYMPVPGIKQTIAGQEKDARTVASRALGHPVTDAEASDYFFGLSRAWMTAHPGDALALFVKKLYYTFNAAHVPLPHSYPFYAYDVPTALRFYIVGPWLLVPLGLVGLALGPRPRDRAYLIWMAFVPAYAAAVALFFVAERYRLPLLVPLCAGAGAAIDRAIAAVQARRWSALATLAAGAAVLAVFANWPVKLDEGRWLEGLRTAQQLVILQRYDEADRWAARLDASNPPRPGAGRYGVGAQLLVLNQPERALPYLDASHQVNPSDATTDYALGQALFKTGRAREAVAHLEHGFNGGIDLPQGGYDYAAALQATGDFPAAVAAIRRITPADSEDPEAWLRLGRLAAQAQAPDAGERFFRHAVQMRPDLAAARQQLGLNLVVLGRFDEAAGELAEASRLDPRDPDTLAHLAYCEYKIGRAADARAHALAALALNPADELAKGIIRAGGS
jgi:tetratricopeptide (TPR) repeat protein